MGKSPKNYTRNRQSYVASKLTDPGTSADGANKMPIGFTPKNRREHWKDHQHEYPGMTEEEYGDRALELIQMPTGGSIHGYKKKNGQICRYNADTNDYVKGHPSIGIASMMKPRRGKAYFDELMEIEALKS